MEGQVLVQHDKSRWTIVRCPGCGDTRRISMRQLHRQESGEASGLCRLCLRPSSMIDDNDDPRMERLRVWWLEQAGIRDLEGLDARTYVRTHGCPPLLTEIGEAVGEWPEAVA